MNRGYSFSARDPPHRDRLQSHGSSSASSSRAAAAKEDLNIDDFGDMGSDEDDFQGLGSNFMPPKPPANPQYNLVPFGFLRDDDELVDDHDGVPINDTVFQDPLQKDTWKSSPIKPKREEIRGNPISVLGSSRPDSNFLNWPNDTMNQGRTPQNFQRLGSSSMDTNISDTSREQGDSSRWDKKVPAACRKNLVTVGSVPPVKGISTSQSQNFVPAQDTTNLFMMSRNIQSSRPSTVRANDDTNPFVKATNRPTLPGSASFSQSTDNNPYIKVGNRQTSTGNAFVITKDSGKPSLPSNDNYSQRTSKPISAQSSSAMWDEQSRNSLLALKGQGQPEKKQTFTPTGIATSTPQVDLMQTAALQQALASLSQLGSQSGLNLLGAQSLLIQASQNPTLAAALVSTGLGSIQPNALEALLKPAGSASVPASQPNLSALLNPPHSNIHGVTTKPQKMATPDGSGATRYPAPDVSSLVFDPSTGYRFDASTGLHYDANSGYFFNNQLKLFLRWDKFTETYLRVDKPPGLPQLSDRSIERMSYVKGSSLASQNIGLPASSFTKSSTIPKDSMCSSNTLRTRDYAKESFPGLASLKSIPLASIQNESRTTVPSVCDIDFSKPPPPIPQTSLSDTCKQLFGTSPLSGVDQQKAAALPNFAETSLFNRLRKAKLAQTAQMKSDRKRWGSPDPLLEAVQKHTAEISKPREDILNLKEILQRSRQFMNKNTGKPDAKVAAWQVPINQSRSEDGKKIRSRSRSSKRSLGPSRSPENLGRHPGRSVSPQSWRSSVTRSYNQKERRPSSRGRGNASLSPVRKRRAASRSKSPINKARRKPSISPGRRRLRSISKSRTPIRRARGGASKSPEARRSRPVSRGRSPLRKRGKHSKSPGSKQRNPTVRSKTPEKRPSRPLGISRIPDRSHSPKVKVTLNQSPGGSKPRVPSPGRLANPRPISEKKGEIRKSSSGCGKSTEKPRALSPVKSRTYNTTEVKTKTSGEKSNKEKMAARGNRREISGKDKPTELKSIPYEKSLSSKSSGSNRSKDVFDYKSLSNLRNQGRDKLREKEPPKKQVNTKQQNDGESSAVSLSVGLTMNSDEEKQGHANHRLVSERTFSNNYGRRKPNSILQDFSSKKTDSDAELSQDSKDDGKRANQKEAIEDEKLQELDEYDFLNDTLDDDKESTIVDEYEEILDYQELECTSEPIEKELVSKKKASPEGLTASPSKTSIDSPVIDLCTSDTSVETNKSAESVIEVKHTSVVGETASSDVGIVVSQDKEDVILLKDSPQQAQTSKDVKVASKNLGKVSDAKEIEIPNAGIDVKEVSSCKILDVPDKTVPNRVDVMKADTRAMEQLGPEVLETEEWKIVDSVDDHNENTTELSNKKINVPSVKLTTISESPKVEDGKSNVTPKKDEVADRKDFTNSKIPKSLSNNGRTNDEVSAKVSAGRAESGVLQASKKDEQLNPTESESEELLTQVRSVSDIEKFLLLSSQEVEAKREQSAEPTVKAEKKADIFSRLGEKLAIENCEPAAAPELPNVTPGSSQAVSGIVLPPAPKKGRGGKTIAAKPKILKKVEPEDPVGKLFNDDKPTSTILIGPMNFFEPVHNFQNFTQKYILRMLEEEDMKAKNVYVCHEDVTGAPYHYILIMFHSVIRATDWFKKRKGRFKPDPKLFKRIAGHTKQKLIPNAVSFVHYTANNWVCSVCKKGNFPARSLCFGCFQHKDPEGFSPVKILDIGAFRKPSNCVGTPKLKFFVTKKKVLESAPPLDGFDIQRIEMIMDEQMGFPAGICVFEMSNMIEAGKLKKYLNRREIEAVSVELNEKPISKLTTSRMITDSRMTPMEESLDEHLGIPLRNSGGPSAPSVKRGRYQGEQGIHEERQLGFSSREIRNCSPSPGRELRVLRGRSPGPSQGVPRRRSPSLLRSGNSRERVQSYSPGYQSRSRSPRRVHEQALPLPHQIRSVREIPSRGCPVSPRDDGYVEPRPYSSQERVYHSPGYQSPVRRMSQHRSPSPVPHILRRSHSPRFRSPTRSRPFKPDGRSDWSYPPPDPNNFKFESKSGLDYDSSTSLYYEPKSCCFYNDDTNEWLEYDPRTGRYILVR